MEESRNGEMVIWKKPTRNVLQGSLDNEKGPNVMLCHNDQCGLQGQRGDTVGDSRELRLCRSTEKS